jgi:hypothetical protein
MVRKITATELQDVMRHRLSEVTKHMNVTALSLGIPVDGKGLRLKASVKEGEGENVPRCVTVDIEGDEVEIPIEVEEDWEPFIALSTTAG